jgi:hypothetical protein
MPFGSEFSYLSVYPRSIPVTTEGTAFNSYFSVLLRSERGCRAFSGIPGVLQR